MNNLDLNKEYTLVGVGCSHTQGCAFTVNFKDNNLDNIEWANKALADKFKVKCTRDFVTNNLTWMAFLKNYLKVNRIINLGYGGLGTTTSIRSLQNLIYNVDDLTNYLVIVQLEYPYRDELLIKTNNNYEYSSTKDYLVRTGSNYEYSNEVKALYTDYFYSEDFAFLDHLYQLLHLQTVLEKLGASVRIFGEPWFKFEHINLDKVVELKKVYKNYLKTGFEKELQGILSVNELLNKLNIIDTLGMSIILKEKGIKQVPTLELDYAIEGDAHYSERGNKFLAEHLYSNLNNKRTFNLNEKVFI